MNIKRFALPAAALAVLGTASLVGIAHAVAEPDQSGTTAVQPASFTDTVLPPTTETISIPGVPPVTVGEPGVSITLPLPTTFPVPIPSTFPRPGQ